MVMLNPKFNNNNHLIDDLKESSIEEDNPISSAIQGFTSKNSGSSDSFKKKMMRNLFIIVIITFIIVILLFIFSSMGGKKSYSEIEDIMIKSAEKYYTENQTLLPKTTGGIVEVSAKKLANLNYMRDLERYQKKANCTGKVVVENNDDHYIYVPYLDCGDDYKTTELYRKITDSKNIVITGGGLYSGNGEYVFRGENINNYVSIGEHLWRIVKVTKDNEIVLIKQDGVAYDTSSWDDRYNATARYKAGINDFFVSRIHDKLEELYKDPKDELFPKGIKDYIVSHSYCVGKRDSKATGSDQSIECSVLSEPLKMGLLSIAEYMYASLDSGCTYTTSSSCQNYNYLVNKKSAWWLSTASLESTYHAYYITQGGAIKSVNTSSYYAVRPVIYLNSRVMFKDGDGSLEKPYQFK